MKEGYRWRPLGYQERQKRDYVLRRFGNVFALQRRVLWFFYRDTDTLSSYDHGAKKALLSLGREPTIFPKVLAGKDEFFKANLRIGDRLVIGAKLLCIGGRPGDPRYDVTENIDLLERHARMTDPVGLSNAPLTTGPPEYRVGFQNAMNEVIKTLFERDIDSTLRAYEPVAAPGSTKCSEPHQTIEDKVVVETERHPGYPDVMPPLEYLDGQQYLQS